MRHRDVLGGVVGARRPAVTSEARSALRVLRWLVAVLLLAQALLIYRQLGEASRIHHAVTEQAADLDEVVARLQAEIRADCAFKLAMVKLPTATTHPTAVLVDLARAAEVDYRTKGCPMATDPRTGRSFGPAPAIPEPSPSPGR